MRARTIRSVIATVVITGGILAGGTAAQAAESDATSRSITITSPSCVEQVETIAAAKRIDPAAGLLLCSGTVKVVESRVEVASTTDVLSFARSERLSQRETDGLVAAAASGGISYRNWTHSYWGGSLVEKHTGRTYWDGKKAWIASYRGFSGKHSCHSEGGIAVGWAVTPLGCSKPKAGSSADAYYRFDAHAAFKGSPITLNIGLHYRTAASGKTTTWQVGG